MWPPAGVVEALAAIDRPQRKGLRWTTADQWHVTLCFLGSLDAVGEAAVRFSLRSVDWGVIGPTELTAGPQPAALGRGVWVLPVEGAGELARAAAGAAAEAGVVTPVADRGRAFHGHITLARAKTPPAMRDLPAAPLHATWTVTEVTLAKSALEPTGARYDIVDSWSLLPGSRV